MPSSSYIRTFLNTFFALISLLYGVMTVLIFAGYTPITPTDETMNLLFLGNYAAVFILLLLLCIEGFRLYRARKRFEAGARSRIELAGIFLIISLTLAISLDLVGSVILERGMNPAFIQDARGFIRGAAQAASLFRDAQCRSLLQEARLTASDLDRAKPLFDADRGLFHEFMSTRIKFLGFLTGALITNEGKIHDRIENGVDSRIIPPEQSDFSDALKNTQECLVADEGSTFVVLLPMRSFENTFLYAARKVDPFSVTFSAQADQLIASYDQYELLRQEIKHSLHFIYGLLAVIFFLFSAWLGLNFAKRFVSPIRRLMAAADQVASGNFSVEVPIHKSEGDLAHLSKTFNKMTAELKLQQDDLIERRLFTEAVLAAVPATVIGIDTSQHITVMNKSAETLLECSAEDAVGKSLESIFPELATLLTAQTPELSRPLQTQISLTRSNKVHLLNIHARLLLSEDQERRYVITLDDITDLVTAQRMSAWADVAKRIAHEIKNPLTPIQLSAERLKRKFGPVIQQDSHILDQCTDTIIRQVDDIKRMVDEFSSFARMPKARLEPGDLVECMRQVLFLMRVGYPQIHFIDNLPNTPLIIPMDRRLFSQALTNLLKNATEGIAARENTVDFKGEISLTLTDDPNGYVTLDIIDNGKGFPVEDRQRLFEPYITTRQEGTGLGLSIVAKIMEEHGGRIELLDAPSGQGAWVKLTCAHGK